VDLIRLDHFRGFAAGWHLRRDHAGTQTGPTSRAARLCQGSALHQIDLWTDRIAGGLPCAGWRRMLAESGFVEVGVGPPVDTFRGAGGEIKARLFEVFGYGFIAYKPK
jgi:hypothetical protein